MTIPKVSDAATNGPITQSCLARTSASYANLVTVDRDRLAALETALRLIYEETADYIETNNLGDFHHNRSMQLARAALAAAPKPKPKPTTP